MSTIRHSTVATGLPRDINETDWDDPLLFTGTPGTVAGFDDDGYAVDIPKNQIGGPVGPAGASAYDIAVENGYIGTEAEWIASVEADRIAAETARTQAQEAQTGAAASAASIAVTPAPKNQNLLDPATLVNGITISIASGGQQADANRTTTPLFPCQPNTTYAVSHKARIVEYTAAGVYVKGALGQLTTGATGAQLRISFLIADTPKVFKLGAQPGLEDLVAYEAGVEWPQMIVDDQAKAALFDANSRLKPTLFVPPASLDILSRNSNNLADPAQFVVDTQLATDLSGLSAVVGSFTTGYMPVTAGLTYRQTISGSSVWYDANFIPISRLIGSTFTAPANAVWARASGNVSVIDAFQFNEGTTNAYVPFHKYKINDDVGAPGALPWSGKTWASIGDSILEGNYNDPITGTLVTAYTNLIGPAIGAGVMLKYAVGGTTIQKRAGMTNSLLERVAGMDANADLITMHGGTNDWSSPFGTFAVRDDFTLYGAMRSMCEQLIAKYPLKTIAFFTPLPRSSRKTEMETVVSIIKEVSAYYNIPCLDLYHDSQMRPEWSATANTYYFTDGLHPSNKGYESASQQMAAWLNNVVARAS